MTSRMGMDSVPRRAMQVRVRKLRGTMFIATEADAFELDTVAEFILRRVDGNTTIKEIATQVAQDFDVSVDEAGADIVELLTQFLETGVVEVVR
jgi:hypothetical protein